MQWRSWLVVPLAVGVIVGSVSCARKPEKSESAPVAPATTVAPQEADTKDEAPAPRAEQAPAHERQYAPAPPGEADLLEREEKARSGAEGSGAKSQPPKRKAAQKPQAPAQPAPRRDRGPVDSLGPPVSTLSIEQAERELESTFSRLGKELQLGSPDCVSAEQFVSRVCELAEHICRLAEQNEEPGELAMCVDGRNRCAESRRRYSTKCAE